MATTITLDEAARFSLTELVARVLRDRQSVCIAAPDGGEVEMRLVAAPHELEPLETLPGPTPVGWKDAIYGPRG